MFSNIFHNIEIFALTITVLILTLKHIYLCYNFYVVIQKKMTV